MSIRPAGLAGAWYSGDAKRLRAEVEACLEAAEELYGRGESPTGALPVAIIAPHAGLAFSGAIAAAAYRLVRDAYPRVDAFVVFGACHRTRLKAPAIWAEGAWETPLGRIEVDTELAAALVAAGAGETNEQPHIGDNAIELQTPFIRHLFPEARIIPVAMGFFPDSWRLGEVAAGEAARRDGVVMAVASTDLTHYGASFGIMPAGVGEPAVAWTRENDQRFLDTLLRLDLKKIVPTADRDSSACGAGAAAAVAGWAASRGCRAGRLLAHATSHEIMPQGVAEHMVGYAAIAYEAGVR